MIGLPAINLGKLKKGVYRMENKFFSSIRLDGKSKHIGVFDTEDEAHEAYLKAVEARDNDGRRS